MNGDLIALDFAGMASLGEGAYNEQLRRMTARLAQDCMARPHDDAAREINIKIKVSPRLDPETNEADFCEFTLEMQGKVPKFRTRQFQLLPTSHGFKMNRHDATNLRAQSLFDDESSATEPAE